MSSIIECKLIFEYRDKVKAENIAKSLEPDNYSYVKCRVENTKLIAELEAESIASLLHTIEDLLVCISIAEHFADL